MFNAIHYGVVFSYSHTCIYEPCYREQDLSCIFTPDHGLLRSSSCVNSRLCNTQSVNVFHQKKYYNRKSYRKRNKRNRFKKSVFKQNNCKQSAGDYNRVNVTRHNIYSKRMPVAQVSPLTRCDSNVGYNKDSVTTRIHQEKGMNIINPSIGGGL